MYTTFSLKLSLVAKKVGLTRSGTVVMPYPSTAASIMAGILLSTRMVPLGLICIDI